jgi:hypothetical protein
MRTAIGAIDWGTRAQGAGFPFGVFRRSQTRSQLSTAAEVGSLFRDLRRALKFSLPELALRLGTQLEVVTALEKGEMARLPPWPETVRVVTAFTALAAIDPRPVLAIMRRQIDALEAASRRKPAARSSRSGAIAGRMASALRSARPWRGAPAVEVSGGESDSGADWRRNFGTLARVAIFALLTLALAMSAYYVQGGRVAISLATVSPSLSRLVQRVHEYVVWQTAPTRDGLKWIDVDDPRARRADKLETIRR